MIGCLVLGDEMAFVLENDPAVQNILIVDTDEGRVFREKLDSKASGQYVRMVSEDELGRLELSGPSVVVWMNDAGLHDDPKTMLEKLALNVHSLEGHCGSVLVFYGLCRNTRYEMNRFTDRFDVPVTLLTDEDGAVVDDCFAAVLGGRERYANMLRASARAILLTPGYAEHWARKLERHGLETLIRQYENYQQLFDTLGYNKVMVLDNGLGDRGALRERARLFASFFDLMVDTARCDTKVFERSYQMAWSRVLVPSPVEGPEREAALSRTLP
ncbi:MAG: DUF1638 domain-containing protein [Methanomassiliicoccus sp.]|nr:DUF1638 domain-containing protein [Methanomassiliicoccus sp.]